MVGVSLPYANRNRFKGVVVDSTPGHAACQAADIVKIGVHVVCSLFRRVSFSAGIAAGLRSYTVLFGAFFLVPFFLERVRHYDPAVIFTTSTWSTARVNSIGCTSGDVVAE